MAYASNIDLVIYGRNQGKIQMVDAILGLREMIDAYKLNTKTGKIEPINMENKGE